MQPPREIAGVVFILGPREARPHASVAGRRRRNSWLSAKGCVWARGPRLGAAEEGHTSPLCVLCSDKTGHTLRVCGE